MTTKPTPEQLQEDLLKALADGDLGMGKYLWKVVKMVFDTNELTEKELGDFQKRIDEFIAEYRIKDGRDGRDGRDGKDAQTPTSEELLSLIRPLIPEVKDGKDGRDAIDGLDGRNGKDGENGKMPAHEWDGTKIRFEKATGEWGEWIDLRGPMGPPGVAYPGEGPGGGMHGLERVIGTNFSRQGVSEIVFGNNLTVSRTPNGVRVDAQAAGGSGSSLEVETPVGAVDDTNTTFAVVNEPFYIVVNGAQYFDGAGYTYSPNQIDLNFPVGQTGFIRSVYQV